MTEFENLVFIDSGNYAITPLNCSMFCVPHNFNTLCFVCIFVTKHDKKSYLTSCLYEFLFILNFVQIFLLFACAFQNHFFSYLEGLNKILNIWSLVPLIEIQTFLIFYKVYYQKEKN